MKGYGTDYHGKHAAVSLRRAAVCAITALSLAYHNRMDPKDYLELIRNAKVYDVADRSRLETAENLSARLDNWILMKREDLQPVFSFKLRGAYNKIAGLDAAEVGQLGRDDPFLFHFAVHAVAVGVTHHDPKCVGRHG